MQAALATRVDQLVECGWELHTTTETTASLAGRRPFSWWLFLLKHEVGLECFLKLGIEVEYRQLQQADCLLQLWRHG